MRILHTPEVRGHLAADGSEPVGGTAEEFSTHIKSEVAKWRQVITEANIKPE